MRFEIIMEQIKTIEKSIKETQHLSSKTASLNYNQLVSPIRNNTQRKYSIS